MSTILITGSEGVVGSALRPALEAAGHDVWGCGRSHVARERYFRCDVAEHSQVRRAAAESNPDIVIHLAAEFGRVNGEEFYPQLWRTNAIGTRNVIDACRNVRAGLIFASTSEVYGDNDAEWLTEDIPALAAISRHNDYADSKWINEQQIIRAEARGDIGAMRLRFFNTYGPGEPWHRYRSVVARFAHAALTGQQLRVHAGYSRTLIYIDDLVAGIVRAADRFLPGVVVNLGGVEHRSIETIARAIVTHANADPGLIHVTHTPDATSRGKRPSIAAARALLGFEPAWTLDAGLAATVAWVDDRLSDATTRSPARGRSPFRVTP